jgi:aryl-alcohol dehydrogenase-like predicted oxidoreductase
MATTSGSLRALGGTGLQVFPLCLGGNVFGWTADPESSFEVLDAYVAAGGNFIDTANGYSRWVPGHDGGESERVIGDWLASRSRRDDVIVATKLGSDGGLGRANVRARAEESLERLKSDYVDIMYAHYDDPDTPPEESLGALDELVKEGKVRHVAASNFTAQRLEEAI